MSEYGTAYCGNLSLDGLTIARAYLPRGSLLPETVMNYQTNVTLHLKSIHCFWGFQFKVMIPVVLHISIGTGGHRNRNQFTVWTQKSFEQKYKCIIYSILLTPRKIFLDESNPAAYIRVSLVVRCVNIRHANLLMVL